MSAINTLDDTKRVAERLASMLCPGDVVTLQGDLGAGKTTFAQFLIQALSAAPVEVTSPTFTLLQTYPVIAAGEACEFYHYDLYRIEHPSALIELGFEDVGNGITLIEWPERLEGYYLPVSLALTLTLADDGTRRIGTSTENARWNGVFA